jgi:DNA-directed RNA polymerase sigma subunit (sigma70/sigma32)
MLDIQDKSIYDQIENVLSKLTMIESKVVRERLGFGEGKQTLAEIAYNLGISVVRAKQIEIQAFKHFIDQWEIHIE